MTVYLQPVVIAGRKFNPAPAPVPVPEYPFYARIKRDYEWTSDHLPRTQGGYGGITKPSYDFRNVKDSAPGVKYGMPDQYAFQPNGFIKMLEPMQWWLLDLNCYAQYRKKYKALTNAQKTDARLQWHNLVMDSTCFTNGMSWKNGYTDYVYPSNLAAKRPLQWEQILCPGFNRNNENYVKVIGSPVRMKVKYFATEALPYEHYPFECIDPARPLPPVEEVYEKRWLCHKPSISTGEPLPGGEYGHAPFPMFDDLCRVVNWAANGIGWIRSDFIERLPGGIV